VKLLDYHRERLVLVGFVAAIVFGGGRANADFTIGLPTNMGPIVNSTAMDAHPTMSPDGLTLFFMSTRNVEWSQYELWVTSRASVFADWEPPVNLGPTVNTKYSDLAPAISADGLTLYFASERPGGCGSRDIWVTTRVTIDDPWAPPVNLGLPVNSSYGDGRPCISADGLSLFFTSWDRPGGFGKGDLWVTTRQTKDDDWEEPVNLGPTVNSPYNDTGPDISSDGLCLFFASDRPGGYGLDDLWVTTRRTRYDPWGQPIHLGPLVNNVGRDGTPNVSADGSTLYFASPTGGFGSGDIWKAPLLPVVDFNGDEIVDAADMCIMVDYWGTNEQLCDIGPMPWGDGIVDVQDLIVLSEYLFTDLRIFVDDDALDDPGPGDPLTSDPLEDGSAEHPFDSIQEAIDAVSFEKGCIVVLPGTYTGDGNRDISFRGKLITVRSIDPSDSHVVATTVIDCQGTEVEQHKGFVFNKGESAQSILAGLTITNAYGQYGGGIHCFGNSSPTISRCVLKNNTAVKGGGGLCNYFGSSMVINCIFTGNTAESGGGLYAATSVRLVNCTIAGNSATEGGAIYNLSGALDVVNCVIWNNGPSEVHIGGGTASVTYSDIQGGFTGQGNIDADPLFADPANGDYHLKSQAGRWDSFSGSWMIDGITSPCIDTGDPNMPVGNEAEPNGARINMGAYGGTIEASMSP